ncbi:SDR family oxidoreductase [Alloalcanivorax mobilis]|uniref:SDR family oxidoreductase n=1 Tax=Alloalcanivorax mobilis TaxID=2019569 RepID=UPI000C76F256|nr:SDR family oxidoreductase [Alloalcanivorax mobilis]
MLPDAHFAGRVALITGGGTGIGQAIATQLAALGADLVIAGRRREPLEDTASALRGYGVKVLPVAMDVRDAEAVQAMVDTSLATFGRIDMLVNNAAGNFRAPAVALSENAWRAVTDIVLHGTWFCTQAVGRVMIEAGGGSILNIGTVGGFHGGPLAVHSASAKGAVLAMSRTLAVEWGAHRVRVNVLTPGATADTGAVGQLFPEADAQQRIIAAIPAGRFARREEIADAACYLLSDYAAYVTGANLVIDGGKWLGRGHLDNPNRPAQPAQGDTP